MRIDILSENPAESELLLQAVGLRPEHRVLWVARTTAEAAHLCATDAPALVLLDVVGTTLDPVMATRQVKAATSSAIAMRAPELRCLRDSRLTIHARHQLCNPSFKAL